MPPKRSIQTTLEFFLKKESSSVSQPKAPVPTRRPRLPPAANAEEDSSELETSCRPPESTLDGLVASLPRSRLNRILKRAVRSGKALTRNDLTREVTTLRNSNFSKLPDELIVMILKYLSLHDRLKMLIQVSRRLREVAGNSSLWTRFRLSCLDTVERGRWIDEQGAFRLLTQFIPENSIRVLSIAGAVITPEDLPFILARHRGLVELHLQTDKIPDSMFANAPLLPDLGVLRLSTEPFRWRSASGDNSPPAPPSLIGFLITLEKLKQLTLDVELPQALFHGAFSFPLHRTLRSFELGWWSPCSFLQILHVLEVCVCLQRLEIPILKYDFELVFVDAVEPNGSYYWKVIVPDELKKRVHERKKIPGGFARLRTLIVGSIQHSRNLTYVPRCNVRSLAPIARLLGDRLRTLSFGGSDALHGYFPKLKTLFLEKGFEGQRYMPQEEDVVKKSAKTRFHGLRAPKLASIKYCKIGFWSNMVHQKWFWAGVRRVFLGQKVKIVELPTRSQIIDRGKWLH